MAVINAAAGLLRSRVMKAFEASPWELGNIIAQGGFGVVFRGKDTYTAVKIARKITGVMGECLAEVSRLRHSNLLNVLEVMANRHGVYVKMEYMNGFELFRAVGIISDSGMVMVVRDLTAATSYLHRRGLVHRDVKPENIIVVNDGSRVVLVDLGSMKPSGDRVIAQGTPEYQAPEALYKASYIVATALDDWSVGATVATVASGTLINNMDACEKLMKSRRLTKRRTMRRILELILPMLNVNPEDRQPSYVLDKLLISFGD